MTYNKSWGTLRVGYVSLTNGAPSAALLPTPAADEKYYVRDLIMTTNDAAQPLVSIADTGTLAKFYVATSQPTICAMSDPIPAKRGSGVTVSAGAVTAGKTVEIKCVAYLSKT